MRPSDWIPGVGHWRSGDRVKGALILYSFAVLGLITLSSTRTLGNSFGHTVRYLRGEPIPFTARHVDMAVSGLLLLLSLLGVFAYAGWSFRRLLRHHPMRLEKGETQWELVWRQFKRNHLAVVGMFMIISLYFVALFAPFIAPFDPTEQGNRVLERLLRPSSEHLLGTDKFARDVFSRIVYGSRISLLVGFLAVGIAVSIGTVYGAVAGYCGRWIDSLMMRFVDMLLSFPTLVLIITIIAVWRKQSIWVIISVIGLISWTGVARLVRGEFLVLKELDYFQGARALGAGPLRLIFRHLLPNAMTPIIVSSTLRVGTTILVEASLSFLGLGVQPPTASWGNIVFDSRSNIFTEWWIPLTSGLAIVVTVVGYNLLGDGLRDALDPRLRK